jgi:hypothetical protein
MTLSTHTRSRRTGPPRHARRSRRRAPRLLLAAGLLALLSLVMSMLPTVVAGTAGDGDELAAAYLDRTDRVRKPRPHPRKTSTTTSAATTTTSVTTTTQRSTATTSAPATTQATSSLQSGLAWAPPTLTNPVTYRVSGTPGVITAAPGQDSVVKFAGSVTKRLFLQGGRNWIISGGEININQPWQDQDDRNAINVKNATGVVHIEGVYVHGPYLNDGIKGCAPDAILQIENTRIVDLKGTQDGYHSDVIQPYCGFRELRVDGLTGYSQFQGVMFKADWGGWPTTTLKRVNLVGIAPQDGYPINVVTGCCNNDGNRYVDGPIYLSDVYVSPDVSHNSGALSGNITPAGDFTFSTDPASGREYAEHRAGVAPQIVGRIWKGRPPSGDYVASGSVGMGYVSPT